MNFKPLGKSEISDLDNLRLDRFTTFLLTNLLFNLPFSIVASLPSSFKCSCISREMKISCSFIYIYKYKYKYIYIYIYIYIYKLASKIQNNMI